jgi:protein-tyrosine-phosphatase
VTSFGTLDADGMPALTGAVEAAAALGVDLSGHRSQTLRQGDLAATDLAIGFEQPHAEAAVEVGEAGADRVFLLLELPGLLDALPPPGPDGVDDARGTIRELDRLRTDTGPRRVVEVPDPIGAPAQVFAEAVRVIDAVTGALAASLFPRPTEATVPRPAG